MANKLHKGQLLGALKSWGMLLLKNPICILYAITVPLAMDESIYSFIRSGVYGTPVWYLKMIADSLYENLFGNLALFLLALTATSYAHSKSKGFDFLTACLAFILTLPTYIIKSGFFLTSFSLSGSHGYRIMFMLAEFLLLFFLFYFLFRFIACFVFEHCSKPCIMEKKNFFHNKFRICCFFTIFVFWLPWIIMNYPGSPCSDSSSQLLQFLGEEPFTSHHPPLSTFIMGVLFVTGDLLVDSNFGYFLYILLHSVVGAWVFSLGMDCLNRLGIKKHVCFVGILFYALVPVWGSFAQWHEKDLLYAEVFTLFLILLSEFIMREDCLADKRKNKFIPLTVVALLSTLLRNNGIYCVLPAMILTAIFAGPKLKKPLWISCLSVLLLYFCITGPLYQSVLGIEKGSIRETLSLPFQQTARYVHYCGDEVTEAEREAIDAVLDYDSLAENYNPLISDPVKATYKNDNSKLPAYFKVWFQMLLKKPAVYFDAFFYSTGDYLMPEINGIEAAISTDPAAYNKSLGIYRIFDTMPTKIFLQIKDAVVKIPIINYLCTPGLYTWLIAACAWMMLKVKKVKGLIVLVAPAMNVLVCLAAPFTTIRYALPVVAAAPFMIGLTYYFVCASRYPNEPVIQENWLQPK